MHEFYIYSKYFYKFVKLVHEIIIITITHCSKHYLTSSILSTSNGVYVVIDSIVIFTTNVTRDLYKLRQGKSFKTRVRLTAAAATTTTTTELMHLTRFNYLEVVRPRYRAVSVVTLDDNVVWSTSPHRNAPRTPSVVACKYYARSALQ